MLFDEMNSCSFSLGRPKDAVAALRVRVNRRGSVPKILAGAVATRLNRDTTLDLGLALINSELSGGM